jgi:putative endonuclease
MNGLLLEAQRSTLLALQSLARRLPRHKPPPAHLLVGERGEFEALFHLRRQGYLIIERRWRSPDHNGDLDLIAWDPTAPAGRTLCFIEVKTRSTRDLTPAASAINDAKRRMIRNMGRSFLRTLPREQRDQTLIRCDVVSVYLTGAAPECELLRDAFPWREADSSRYGV